MPAKPVPPELLSFLDGLAEPHIVIDRQYRIVAANPAWLQQFGPAEGGAAAPLGRTCYAVSHHFDKPCDQSGESCPMARARESGQRERVLHRHHTPRGEQYVEITLTPLRDARGEPAFFVERMQAQPQSGSSGMGAGLPAARGLVGRSLPFQQLLARVARVAPSEASVLLLGESGTGKELVARALHEASARAAAPLVVVDCASLPETLFESELFGHERGAFTGATHARPGLVEAAAGGTLFLDEVGDIPLAIQVKLLRLLENGRYRRVGSTELRRADVRVLAATHRDLAAMVAQGRFREDLYHRLAVFPIHLPPLRERAGDVPLLARALLRRVAPGRGLKLSLTAEALLTRQPFPGNVRQLRNVLERATLLCDGPRIERQHIEEALAGDAPPLPARGQAAAAGLTAPAVALPDPAGPALLPAPAATAAGGVAATLRQREDAALAQALAEQGGSRAALARSLGISERTLYRRLRRLAGPGA